MTVNQSFKKATNFLKKEGKVNKLYDIADLIHIDRELFRKIRYGSPKLNKSSKEVIDLVTTFPETKRFFEDEGKEIALKEDVSQIELYKRLTNSLDSIIEHQKTIDKLKEKITRLTNEIAELKRGQH